VHGATNAAWLTVNVWPAIVSVPVRAAPALAATVKLTEPPPLPDAPAVIVIQSGLLDVAVQAQPAAAVTVVEPEPPALSAFCEVGAMLNEHAAASVTVNGWPAIVNVPVRAAAELAAAENATEPAPLPVEPPVIVSQSGFAVVAVHVHPLAAETATLQVPPVGPSAWLDGEIEGLHPAACDKVKTCPAIASVPVRAGPSFAAKE